MADIIQVLYVDDEPGLLDLGKMFLEESGDFSVATIDSAPAALELLKKENYDAIISDYQMPGMDGIEFLIEVRTRFGEVPFILFTGRGREEVVIQAINNKADFYLQKGGEPNAQFAELSNKLNYAVSRKRVEKALKESENRYRNLFHEMLNGFAVHEIICNENGIPSDYRFIAVNPAFERMTGLSGKDLIGKTVLEVMPGTEPFWIERYGKVALTGSPDYFENYSQELGKYYEVSVYQNAFRQFTTVISDVTDRKLAEEELKQTVNDLQRFNTLTVDRELYMIELKKEVNTLLNKIGEDEKYRIVE